MKVGGPLQDAYRERAARDRPHPRNAAVRRFCEGVQTVRSPPSISSTVVTAQGNGVAPLYQAMRTTITAIAKDVTL
jgi:hypothetical protein